MNQDPCLVNRKPVSPSLVTWPNVRAFTQIPTEATVENTNAQGFLTSQLSLPPREVTQGAWGGMPVDGPNCLTTQPAVKRRNTVSKKHS